ncbi:MAG TPA: MOSC N-terminal beta barrel domain-containing protein [Ktedonobacterales bacterium]|nr:MOSC N-terminal beta barrel domain-containing protein [Ktedonobacterales bacterium]
MHETERRLVGRVAALYRYPVKSMRGEALDEARLAREGIEGDRRYAFVQSEDRSQFPWLTARQSPSLVRYAPYFVDAEHPAESAVRVQTPDGLDLPVEGDALLAHIGALFPRPIHLVHLPIERAMDAAAVSLISTATIAGVGTLIDRELEPRRFRPNILLVAGSTSHDTDAYPEAAWLGRALTLGDGPVAPRIYIQARDQRCKMVNVAPETGTVGPYDLLAAMVRADRLNAGVYARVERPGLLEVGAPIWLEAAEQHGER